MLWIFSGWCGNETIHKPGGTSKDSRPFSLSWPSLPSKRPSWPSIRPSLLSRPFWPSWPSSLSVGRFFNHSAQQWKPSRLSNWWPLWPWLIGWWIEFNFQRIFKGWHSMTKFYTMFESFWYFQDDVEMGQSTNLEKHLKIQGLSRFHGLHRLQNGLHCLQIK